MGAEQSVQQRSYINNDNRFNSEKSSVRELDKTQKTKIVENAGNHYINNQTSNQIYLNEYGQQNIFQTQGGYLAASNAHSQVISNTNSLHQSQLLDPGNTQPAQLSQRSINTYLGNQAIQRPKSNNRGYNMAHQTIPIKGSINSNKINNTFQLKQQNEKRNVVSAQGSSQTSGFNSLNSQSKRIGPYFGSGAYSQKQKVGILEPTHQTLSHITAKLSDKQSQVASRKSAGAYSVYKSNIVMRPGFANKHSNEKGYDQFQAKTTNILEEMVLYVLSEAEKNNIQQFKSLTNLTNSFEQSLKQIIIDLNRNLEEQQDSDSSNIKQNMKKNMLDQPGFMVYQNQQEGNIEMSNNQKTLKQNCSPKSQNSRLNINNQWNINNNNIILSGSQTTKPRKAIDQDGEILLQDNFKMPQQLYYQLSVDPKGQQIQIDNSNIGNPDNEQILRKHLEFNVPILIQYYDDQNNLEILNQYQSSFMLAAGTKYKLKKLKQVKSIMDELG